ncbi:hypothetical protein HIM_01193 [Hirsutella minnesotensis 3608]|nr:hypothetical protein HIM_01193 [Hirsutella minnesotensis 3608]
MSGQPADPDIHTKPSIVTKTYHRDVYPAIDPASADLCQADKVTIITGAGKGIGPGIAAAHAKAGVRGLVLVARSLPDLQHVRDSILADHPSVEILVQPADISDEQAVRGLFFAVKNHFGTADTLINCAGVISPGFDAVERVTLSTWWNDFEVNTKGSFLTTSAFLRLLKEKPVKEPTVINIVSNIDLVPPTLSSYFSSKAAVMKFTEVLQSENQHLAAYTLNPGLVNTDSTLDAFKPFAKDTPALVGAVTNYLAAKRPAYLKGRHINTNWNLEELQGRKEEIERLDLFKLSIRK